MSVPPTKQHLQALAGWSLLARQGTSDRQHLALCRFGESAGELADVVDELVPSVSHTQAHVSEPIPRRQAPAPIKEPFIPEEVKQLAIMPPEIREGGACPHKFNITTQRCVYCGRTFFDVMARKPELM